MDIRRVVNAIFYVNRTGCQWRQLPHDVPNWRLVYYYFSTWLAGGRWVRIPDALLAPTRRKAGKTAGTPSAGSIDRPTVQATEGADRGSDGGTRIQGRKRHKIADTLGLLFALVVTGAKVEDAAAAPALVRQIRPVVCSRWELLCADSKYHNHALEAWMGRTNAGPVRIEVTRRTDDEPGFKPIQWRWVIERTNGWVKRSRRNAMDYEKASASSEALVRIATTKIMLNRLTGEKPEFPVRYPRVKKSA